MLNQIVLVGRFLEWKSDNVFTLSVSHIDPEHCPIVLPITVSDNMAEQIEQNVSVNDVVGIKASFDYNSKNKVIISASKFSYLGKGMEVVK